MKRSIALSLAGSAVLASTAAGPAQAAATPVFGPCPPDVAAEPQLRCATVDVPLDHDEPAGERLRLTISKLPARKPAARRGSLLVNPGGPGGPGISFAAGLARSLPGEVLDSYDLIGFDTRNTAHSEPISCADPATYWKTPLPDPDSPQARELNWRRAAEYADGCQARAGKYLPHLTTDSNVRDMDLVRQSLGEERISFLGYSYGTYLGAVYGERFPQHVDRMVLDSSVNPATSQIWYRNNLDQDAAAQRRLDDYLGWIARHDGVFRLGSDPAAVRASWQAVQDDLRARPRGPLGPAEFIAITFDALYSEDDWTDLGHALSAYRNRHDDRALVAKVKPKGPAEENSNAIYNAVECADAPWPSRRSVWERDATEIARTHPFAAWYNSWTVAPCASWHAPRQRPVRISGSDLPPVLMFNSTGDVATPYEGAREMHRALPSSVLVTEENAGKHGVFALAGNTEADRIGTDYLVRGVLPAEDVAIPGHPLPDPAKPLPEAKTVRLR
ncbi:alpha/beta hydrolase [Saccharopolyspora taberi]|uniref:Alpha/beta hydrolase n=1 Tax=Saccharopolyspora taberi TaxID=60895 RepID=A0ABN3VEE7_9PSEU